MATSKQSDQEAPATAGASEAQRTSGGRAVGTALAIVERYGVVLAVAVLFAGFSIALPDTFFTAGNVETMVNAQAIILVLAIAATLPLRAGDFDLSIPAVMTVSAAIVGQLALDGVAVPFLFLAALLVGLVVGLVNGLLIVRVGVDAFITTLGTLTALGGAAYALTDNTVISGFPQGLLDVSRTEFLGLPALTWYGWILVGVAWYVYERTPLGRYILFIGGSREAARLAGVRVDRLRILTFVASAMLSALAGLFFASSIGSADPSVSGQYLLQPFAAAFLGATTIALGRFNALGTTAGLYLLVVGITGLQLLGAEPWVSDVFNGTALVLAVTFARLAAMSRGSKA